MAQIPAFAIPVQKFGRIPDIDAGDTNEEVWDGEGAHTLIAAAAAMTVSSSSTDDDGDPVGTGALTARVIGLNASWEEVVQDVTLNGQTAVSLPTSLIRVYRAYVLTAGTGGVNAGNIWVGTGALTAGVPAVKHAGILAGMGQTLMATYSVPTEVASGQTINSALITRWYATVGAVSAAFATVALQTRAFGGSWRTRRIAGIAEGSSIDEEMTWGIEVATKTDIRVRVITNGVNNSAIAGGFDVALRQATAG